MQVIPLGERVLIKKAVAEEKTKSGIILSNETKEMPHIAEVIAIGEGEIVDGKEIVMRVKVGDKVIYPNYVGIDIEVGGSTYIIIKQSELLGIIKD